MTKPSPALVAQRAVQRLPRPALLMFCAAYLLPGVFGRDPWKNADISALGYMARLATGQTEWLRPELAGLLAPGGLVPYWIGAVSIKLFSPWIAIPLAARLPFALLLAGTLALTWYACFHLARRDKALPLAFAFGGEANPVDYGRAVADGAVLALIAQLGLLQLGHETTPELVQLFAMALLLYGMAAAQWRQWTSRIALLVSPCLLAASGAPSSAALLGVSAALYFTLIPSALTPSATDQAASSLETTPTAHTGRATAAWLLTGTALAIGVGIGLEAWQWRVQGISAVFGFPRLFAWFTWPVWPMAGWTLWRWRSHWLQPHIALPLLCALLSISVSVAMGGSDRALLLALPGLAVLAAFSLPTLQRSLSAAMDWFSVLFFTGWALTFWTVYLSMHAGLPRQPAINVARLLPGFTPSFNLAALLWAVLGTVAWLWLVAWRTGKHRHPLWKSLVLPAGGVALNWLLAMTLLLPPLDYARSYRPQITSLARHLPAGVCVYADGLTGAQIAALEVIGGWQVRQQRPEYRCAWQLQSRRFEEKSATPPGWQIVTRVRRPTDKDETLLILRRN